MPSNNTTHAIAGLIAQTSGDLPSGDDASPAPPHKTRPVSALGRPLSVRQVAAMLGCSVCTVRQTLVRQGLPVFRFGPRGKLVCFENQVIAWLRKLQGEMKK